MVDNPASSGTEHAGDLRDIGCSLSGRDMDEYIEGPDDLDRFIGLESEIAATPDVICDIRAIGESATAFLDTGLRKIHEDEIP